MGTNEKKKHSIKKPKSSVPRGRPTLQTQETVRKDIQDYYIKGYTPQHVIFKTGYAKTTVYSYYNEFLEETRESSNFMDRQAAAVDRYELALDRIQETLEEQISRCKAALKPGRFDTKVETVLTNATNALERVHNHKVNVQITPTLDISLPMMIKDKYGIDLEELAKEVEQKSQ